MSSQDQGNLKQQARRLRSSLAERGVEVTHSEALEHLAHQHGARDWNTLTAAQPDVPTGPTGATTGPAFGPAFRRAEPRAIQQEQT